MKIGRIAGLLLGGAIAATTVASCGRSPEEEKKMWDDAWKYRDSVFHKDQRAFFDNCDTTLVIPKETPKPDEFYWKWKNINDSLNNVKKLKALEATKLYKVVR